MTKEIELGPFKVIDNEGTETKEYFEPRFTVTIGPLGGADSMTADDYVGESVSENRMRKTYAICSIQRINGKQVHPLQDYDQFQRVLRRFDGKDGLVRVNRLTQEFIMFAAEAASSPVADAVESDDEAPA